MSHSWMFRSCFGNMARTFNSTHKQKFHSRCYYKSARAAMLYTRLLYAPHTQFIWCACRGMHCTQSHRTVKRIDFGNEIGFGHPTRHNDDAAGPFVDKREREGKGAIKRSPQWIWNYLEHPKFSIPNVWPLQFNPPPPPNKRHLLVTCVCIYTKQIISRAKPAAGKFEKIPCVCDSCGREKRSLNVNEPIRDSNFSVQKRFAWANRWLLLVATTASTALRDKKTPGVCVLYALRRFAWCVYMYTIHFKKTARIYLYMYRGGFFFCSSHKLTLS